MFAKSDVSYTLGSRGYFFLIDTDGSRRSRVNEAQSVNAASVSIRKKSSGTQGMSPIDTKAVSCLKAVQFNIELSLIRSVRHNTCNSIHQKSLTFFL